MGVDGCVQLMKYKVCSKVEHKNKLLAPKWDSFHKHSSRRKAKRNMKGVKKHEWCTNNKHDKNVVIYACKGRESILQQITTRLASEKCRKSV
jgi:peroxiredoxin family protein